MKITGIGPKIGIITSLYLIIAITADLFSSPYFNYSASNNYIRNSAGTILILTGIILLIIMAGNLQRSFRNDILMTGGPYRYFRNPMYAMYIIFIIPGISLILNSWLVLTTSAVMYVSMCIYIREEYEFLEGKYGDEYRNYLKKVWVKFL